MITAVSVDGDANRSNTTSNKTKSTNHDIENNSNNNNNDNDQLLADTIEENTMLRLQMQKLIQELVHLDNSNVSELGQLKEKHSEQLSTMQEEMNALQSQVVDLLKKVASLQEANTKLELLLSDVKQENEYLRSAKLEILSNETHPSSLSTTTTATKLSLLTDEDEQDPELLSALAHKMGLLMAPTVKDIDADVSQIKEEIFEDVSLSTSGMVEEEDDTHVVGEENTQDQEVQEKLENEKKALKKTKKKPEGQYGERLNVHSLMTILQ